MCAGRIPTARPDSRSHQGVTTGLQRLSLSPEGLAAAGTVETGPRTGPQYRSVSFADSRGRTSLP